MVQRFATGAVGEGRDPVASYVMKLEKKLKDSEAKLDMALNEIANKSELDRIKDEEERSEVMEHFNQNRHRLADVKGARAEIREKRLEKELEQERLEREKLAKALAATSKRQNPDVVRTHDKEVTAQELQARTMTRAEFKAEQDRLEEAWKQGDAEAAKKRMAQQRAVRNKQIQFKD